MPLPRSLARFNRVGTNRVARHVTPHVPGFGVVHHVGRRSGSPYRTPVNVFARPGGYAIALTYGPDAEWVKNVVAAGRAVITTRGEDHAVEHPQLVRSERREFVPAPVRRVLGWLEVDSFLLVDEVPAAPATPPEN
jgi:deazaflavin-dependent oxidoreductase (nitroreductase family)